MIGYYVHHHGRGHLTRMRSITAALATPVTVLSSLRPEPVDADRAWVVLPRDDDPAGRAAGPADPAAGGTLHWAPRHHPGLRRRMALIAAWIDACDPDLMIVDVSVEVTALCRLLGVPVAVAGMRGDRTDRPHRMAYDAADLLIAPWPAACPEPWPAAWLAKTVHTGALSRFDRLPAASPRPAGARPTVVVLWGGDGDVRARVREAAAATPDHEWVVPADDEVWDRLQTADVVVAHAGQNAVAEVAAARRPAVVVADDRPHGEQEATARALQAAGLAVAVCGWPAPDRWPGLLAQARRGDGDRWALWNDGAGAARAAAAVTALARRPR